MIAWHEYAFVGTTIITGFATLDQWLKRREADHATDIAQGSEADAHTRLSEVCAELDGFKRAEAERKARQGVLGVLGKMARPVEAGACGKAAGRAVAGGMAKEYQTIRHNSPRPIPDRFAQQFCEARDGLAPRDAKGRFVKGIGR